MALKINLSESGRVPCPECKERIYRDAKKCPHCQSDLTLNPEWVKQSSAPGCAAMICVAVLVLAVLVLA